MPDSKRRPRRARSHPKARILVVDDDSQLRSTVTQMLEAAGLEAAGAEGGAQAIEMARRERFDLILADVWMPGMSGIEMLSKLRAEPSPPRAIVMTGYDSPETQLKAIREKACHYITKPFTKEQLVYLVRQVLAAPAAVPPIEVLSARNDWVELLVPCDLACAERINDLIENLKGDLPEDVRQSLGQAFREMVINAIEWGGQLDPRRKVRISCIRGRRMLLYRISDPGTGFRPEDLTHAAVNNPPEDPARHVKARVEKGMRPGGFGMVLARTMVDELIYNEAHNEVVLIKYLDPDPNPEPKS